MRRVIKVGGSLLVRRDLVDTLTDWFSRHSAAENLVIVGGGDLINAIRDMDRIHGGDPIETHWRCVELLDVTFELFSTWSGWNRLNKADRLSSSIESGFPAASPTLVAVSTFYTPEQSLQRNVELPQDWRTTTDAIAGLLACVTRADELVLLKSCDVDPAATLEQLSQQGIVDGALPMIESKIRRIRVEKLV